MFKKSDGLINMNKYEVIKKQHLKIHEYKDASHVT